MTRLKQKIDQLHREYMRLHWEFFAKLDDDGFDGDGNLKRSDEILQEIGKLKLKLKK